MQHCAGMGPKSILAGGQQGCAGGCQGHQNQGGWDFTTCCSSSFPSCAAAAVHCRKRSARVDWSSSFRSLVLSLVCLDCICIVVIWDFVLVLYLYYALLVLARLPVVAAVNLLFLRHGNLSAPIPTHQPKQLTRLFHSIPWSTTAKGYVCMIVQQSTWLSFPPQRGRNTCIPNSF